MLVQSVSETGQPQTQTFVIGPTGTILAQEPATPGSVLVSFGGTRFRWLNTVFPCMTGTASHIKKQAILSTVDLPNVQDQIFQILRRSYLRPDGLWQYQLSDSDAFNPSLPFATSALGEYFVTETGADYTVWLRNALGVRRNLLTFAKTTTLRLVNLGISQNGVNVCALTTTTSGSGGSVYVIKSINGNRINYPPIEIEAGRAQAGSVCISDGGTVSACFRNGRGSWWWITRDLPQLHTFRVASGEPSERRWHAFAGSRLFGGRAFLSNANLVEILLPNGFLSVSPLNLFVLAGSGYGDTLCLNTDSGTRVFAVPEQNVPRAVQTIAGLAGIAGPELFLWNGATTATPVTSRHAGLART
jgi:hypothetical protein